MYKKLYLLFLVVAVLSVNNSLFSDEIVLKNGLKLKGTFKGGTEKIIKFKTSGEVQQISISEIKSITFTAASATSAKSAETTGAATSSSSVKTIPAGTKITVKTKNAISTAQHKQGTIIDATLDLDLMVGGKVVAPKGSTVYGKVVESVGGRRIGLQRIVVQFNYLVINGKKVAIDTDPVGAEGGRGSAAKMIGAGALFGAAGGEAGKGAAIGAGVALLAGGKHIQIPAGSKVELTIKKAVNIN